MSHPPQDTFASTFEQERSIDFWQLACPGIRKDDKLANDARQVLPLGAVS